MPARRSQTDDDASIGHKACAARPHGPARGETTGMDTADSVCHQDNDVH